MQIQISWLLQKPTDLDLHCLQRQGISGLSRKLGLKPKVLGRTSLSKNCRPRSHVTKCSIWSESTLFATHQEFVLDTSIGSGGFSTIMYKEDNCYDFLFAVLHISSILERIYSILWERLLSFKSRPFFRRKLKTILKDFHALKLPIKNSNYVYRIQVCNSSDYSKPAGGVNGIKRTGNIKKD